MSSNTTNADFTFYYTFTPNSSDNGWITIDFFWFGINSPFYVFIDKNSFNINKIRIINIPNNAKGKNMTLWIWKKGRKFSLVSSINNNPITVIHKNLNDLNEVLNYAKVESNSYLKLRGLLTNNILTNTSKAFEEMKKI